MAVRKVDNLAFLEDTIPHTLTLQKAKEKRQELEDRLSGSKDKPALMTEVEADAAISAGAPTDVEETSENIEGQLPPAEHIMMYDAAPNEATI